MKIRIKPLLQEHWKAKFTSGNDMGGTKEVLINGALYKQLRQGRIETQSDSPCEAICEYNHSESCLCLYGWKRQDFQGKDLWLYIGASICVLKRIFNHGVLNIKDNVLDNDTVVIWRFPFDYGINHLFKREEELIKLAQPKFNIKYHAINTDKIERLRIELKEKIKWVK